MNFKMIYEESPRANGEIPDISDEQLYQLDAKFNIVVIQDGLFFTIETPNRNPRSGVITWRPKLVMQVRFAEVFRSELIVPSVYQSQFAPTKSEVLCQIPEQLKIFKTAADAFYINMDIQRRFSTGIAFLSEVVWGKISKV